MISDSSHLYFQGIVKPSRCRPAGGARAAPAGVSAHPEAELDRSTMAFFAWLFDRAELPLENYRRRPLARRLRACLRMLNVSTPEAARIRLEDDPTLLPATLNMLLLGVTEFCRDRQVFDQLTRVVLPRLLSRHRTLRIWSAACSDGHELYSVAMALADAGRLEDCELLGTDLRADAIERARAGAFHANSLANLDPQWRSAYVEPQGHSPRIAATIRNRIRWRTANLFHAIEPGPWELILWRNMAIYLTPCGANLMWTRLCDQLSDGACLVTGKAEQPPASLPLRRLEGCIYYRTLASHATPDEA